MKPLIKKVGLAFLALFTLSIAVNADVFEDTYTKAKNYFRKGNYSEAHRSFMNLVKGGNYKDSYAYIEMCMQKMKEESDSKDSKIKELSNDIVAKEKNLSTQKKQIEDKDNKISSYSKQVDSLKNYIDSLCGSIDSLNVSIASLNEDNIKKEETIRDLNGQLQHYADTLSNQKLFKIAKSRIEKQSKQQDADNDIDKEKIKETDIQKADNSEKQNNKGNKTVNNNDSHK